MEPLPQAAFGRRANPESPRRGRDLLVVYIGGAGIAPVRQEQDGHVRGCTLIAEKEARKEVKNSFYSYLDDERVMGGIFRDFGMDPEASRIVCGHVPVKVKGRRGSGEVRRPRAPPSTAASRSHQPTTGIASYALISKPPTASFWQLTSRSSRYAPPW